MKLLGTISSRLNRLTEISLATLGVSMAVIVALQVFFRYVLNHSLFWSEELARFLLIWLTFLGATAAYYRKIHPSIDILTIRLPAKIQRLSKLGVHLISAFFFCIMIYQGCLFSIFVKNQISPALGIPKWLLFSIIPSSGTIFLIHCFRFVVEEFSGTEQ